MPTGATVQRPSCDASLTDGVNTVNIYLCKPNGEPDPNQMRQAGFPRQALRFNPSGTGGPSDLEPPYTPISQEDFSGGRGNELFSKDASRFYDSWRADTIRGKLFLGPLETYTTGYYSYLTNFSSNDDYTLTAPAGYTKLAASSITPGTTIIVRKIRFKLKLQAGATYPLSMRAHIYSDSSGPSAVLADSDWKPFSKMPSTYKNYDFEIPATTLTSATKYWIVIESAAVGTLNVGKQTSASGNAIYTKTSGAWANEVNNQALVFTLYTVASGYVFFFEHQGGLYCTNRSDDQNVPTIFINGYRGKATSNAADKTKLNTTLNLSGVNLAGCIARLPKGPGSTEEFPYRVIVSNTTTGSNDVITVDKTWKITHTTSTDFVILGCNTWTEVTGHGLTKPITDVCSIDDRVYFCQGDAAVIRSMKWSGTSYSFDGEASNQAEKLKFFIDGSGKKKLIRCVTGTNDVALASIPTWATDISFGSNINCGSEDERITNIAMFGGNSTPMIPYIFKEGSFGSINNGIYAESPNSEFASIRNLNNGRAALRHDMYLYFQVLNGMVLRYVGSNLDSIGPDLDEGLPPERCGVIRDFAGYGGRFYACMDAGDDPNHYSSILCYNETGWHEIYRSPGGKRIRKLYIQALPGQTMQRLWVSEEEDILWLPLAVDPLKESAYPYTSTCTFTTSWIDDAYIDLNKYFSSLKLITKNCLTAHRYVTAEYQCDAEDLTDTWHTITGTFDTSPSEKLALSASHNVTGKRIRLRLTLTSDDPLQTPQVRAITMDTILRQPVKKSYSITFRVADYPFDLNGVQDTVATATSQMAQLQTWADSETQAAPLLLAHRDSLFDQMYVLIEPPTAQPLEQYINPADNSRHSRIMATMAMIGE